jgi:DNA-directed RNA polymerase
MNPDELDRSLERLARSEEHRTRTTGLGTTKQGQALARQYRQPLVDRIAEDRAYGRHDRDVWRALKGTDDALALRLLVAGISVSEPGELGADGNGEKNYRDQARWIGSNFGQQRKLGLKVGAWGINMLQDLPVFALDTGDVLRMTASADAFMDDVLARAVKANPLLTPLDTPPEDWTQVRTGGLPAGHWAKVPLIRERHHSIENAVRKAISTRQMVLDAVNSLQRVPFVINEPLLEFMLRTEEVPQGFDVDMVTAEAMTCVERFWVPLNIDFRGRINPIPHFNFAREDRVRALFLFADGERIGEEGLLWLKNHVAGTANGNTWSRVEKPGDLGTFARRVAWTEDNLKELCGIGRAVLRGDDPATLYWALHTSKGKLLGDAYQFLAACGELVQALDSGPDFITRLPLTFDGSCSGLQHLCAMTRADEGRYANLVAADEADDFYRRVAFRTWQTIPENLRGLMDSPFDRDIVKQSAMSYFYGSRPGGFSKSKDGRWDAYGMTKQIIDVLQKRRKNSTEGAKELAQAVYDAIEGMVPRATAVRDFLEQLAKLCAKEGKSLSWTTPLGLPVVNCYYKPEIERIAVPLKGRRRRVNFVVGDTEDIHKAKAANAVTANFVHSVDAAHLQLIELAAAKEGIALVTVHDCFGCLASRAQDLNDIIRKQFLHLHKRHNVLARVWASARRDLPKHVKLPPLPETGDLEIEQVLASFNAFK